MAELETECFVASCSPFYTVTAKPHDLRVFVSLPRHAY